MIDDSLADVFDEGVNTLIKVGENPVADMVVDLIQRANEKHVGVVHVGIKESYLQVRQAAMEQDVSVEQTHFVDCVIKTLPDTDIPEEEDVIYADRNESLKNIATAVATLVGNEEEKQVVIILDSLEACLDRHSVEDVVRFLEILQQQLRTKNNSIVLFDEGRAVEKDIGTELFNLIDNILFIENTG